jgi:hypothetical protein
MENNNLYLLQLTVYQYDKNKIKMDYSFIPVTVDKTFRDIPEVLKSEVSNEKIEIKKMHFSDRFFNSLIGIQREPEAYAMCFMYGKKKEGKAVKVSMLVKSKHGMELEEEAFKKDLFKHFKRHFFFNRKYISFLKKKVANNQF